MSSGPSDHSIRPGEDSSNAHLPTAPTIVPRATFDMVPIPPALTQSITFNLKLVATKGAVGIARALTFPIIQEGSFVYFKDDFLLIGNVCGRLRSLISLLAIGTLMAYFSKARLWARILTLVLSCPIAVISNIFRIFLNL